MDKRTIGSLQVSVVGLGCNNFGSRLDAASTAGVVDAAIEAGINFFDTADIYGKTLSEKFLGQALKGRRDSVIIATKFGMKVDENRRGARPDYILAAAEDSLQRLGTDYIDLYQVHQPDASVPIADTLGALDQLVRTGKVREIGCSNFSAKQVREAEAAGTGARFVSVQNEMSLLHRNPGDGVLDECQGLGLGFLPYFPLASGLLSGKYRRGQPVPPDSRIGGGAHTDVLNERNLEIVERLIAFTEALGRTILEAAFAWLLAHDAVSSVIAGATRPEQVRRNAAAGAWRLTADEVRQVEEIAGAPR